MHHLQVHGHYLKLKPLAYRPHPFTRTNITSFFSTTIITKAKGPSFRDHIMFIDATSHLKSLSQHNQLKIALNKSARRIYLRRKKSFAPSAILHQQHIVENIFFSFTLIDYRPSYLKKHKMGKSNFD